MDFVMPAPGRAAEFAVDSAQPDGIERNREVNDIDAGATRRRQNIAAKIPDAVPNFDIFKLAAEIRRQIDGIGWIRNAENRHALSGTVRADVGVAALSPDIGIREI